MSNRKMTVTFSGGDKMEAYFHYFSTDSEEICNRIDEPAITRTFPVIIFEDMQGEVMCLPLSDVEINFDNPLKS